MPSNTTKPRNDTLIEQFESECRAGRRPELAKYLAEAEPYDRPRLLRELVPLDLEYALKEGRPVRVEDYLAQHPELSADRTTVLALIRIEYQTRVACAQPVTRGEYQSRFPALGGEVTRALANLGGGPPLVAGYEVLGELGRGGMGVVYRARDTQLNRDVALKMLRDPGTSSDRERFEREARAVAKLQHPNVVQVFEVGEADGELYFAMEFCLGGSLDRKLADKPLSPRAAAELVEQLARAVNHAHAARVIHRDIKPANVLLAADGTPKLTDFGLAKPLDDPGQTLAGAVMGTPSYMPPEQTRGANVGPRADVYALGAVLYECLTGRPPFRAADVMDTLALVREVDPVQPCKLQPAVPVDLETICLKCLRKAPNERYASAQELADDLARFLEGRPVVARPVGTAARAIKWAKREPMKATALALALVATLVAVGVLLYSNAGLSAAYTKESDARRDADAARDAAKTSELTAVATANRETLARYDLQQALKRVEELLKKEKELSDKEKQAQRSADRRLTTIYAVRGQALCEQGDVRTGLLSFADALRACPEDDAAVQRALRLNVAAWARASGGIAARLEPKGGVWTIGFDPTGRVALAGTTSGAAPAPNGQTDQLQLWDPLTGKLRGKPLPSGGRAHAFSADGTRFATVDGAGNVSVYDTATGEPVGKPRAFKGGAAALALSVDGALIVTAGEEEIVSWSVATGAAAGKRIPHDTITSALVLDPANKFVFAAAPDGTVRAWDRTTGAPLDTLKHDKGISQFGITPDGKALFVLSFDKLYRYDVETRKEIGAPLPLRSGTALAFHPTESIIAVPGITVQPKGGPVPPKPPIVGMPLPSGAQVEIWDLTTGKLALPPLPHTEFVETLAFSADGTTLLTATRKGMRRWSASTGEPLGPVTPLDAKQAALRPGTKELEIARGARALANCDGSYFQNGREAWLWHTPGTQLARVPFGDTSDRGSVQALAFPTGHTECLVATTEGTRFVNPLAAGTRGEALPGKFGNTPLAVSPNGKLIVTRGTGPSEVQLWDAATTKPFGPALKGKAAPDLAAFTPDSIFLLTSASQGVGGALLALWEVSTGARAGDPVRAPGGGTDVLVSPDGTRFVSLGFGGIALGKLGPNGIELGQPLPIQQVRQAAYAPDGSALFVLAGGTIEARNPTTGEKLNLPSIGSGEIGSLALSRDGKRVATTSGKTARVWDVATGKPLSAPLDHPADVSPVCFSPDGELLLTGCKDQKFRLWSAELGQRVGPELPHAGWPKAAAFSADGRVIATGANGARFWHVPQAKAGTADEVRVWAELLTGRALDPSGSVRALPAVEWQKRRDQLGDKFTAP